MIPEKQKFDVNVKIINSNMENIYFEMNKDVNSTIYDIKNVLYNKTGIHPNHQSIIFEGKKQNNNILLEGLKIGTNKCLHMVVLSPNIF